MKQVDKAEKGIRFGCGFVFGLMLGGIWGAVSLYNDTSSMLGLAITMATVCGLASLIFGDKFWHAMKKWAWWF